MDFNSALSNAVKSFKDYKGVVKLVSHFDTDGLTSISILIKALQREDIKFSASVVKQLDNKVLNEIKHEGYRCIIFSDLGSGYIKEINEIFNDELVIILDHHIISQTETRFFHINPLIYGENGNSISGAGLAYLFSKELNIKNKNLAYLAIIGAVGDIQEDKGFKSFNKNILEDAIETGKIEVRHGLRMFGSQTKPLHKILQFSTDPFIPGITGNEFGAVTFLNELGIQLKDKDGRWRKLIHLDKEEMKKLVTGIVIRRINEDKPEDILGQIYILAEEPEESPTRDVREFSTLLNCCGRLDKPTYGIGTCIGSKEMRERAITLLNDYRMELIKALDWFYRNRASKFVFEGEDFVIINARDNIRDTLIGTIASIISKSNVYKEGTKIMALAHTSDGKSKISFRLSGFAEGIDLRSNLGSIMSYVGKYEFGGHSNACGGIIPQEKESLFIETAIEKLKSS